MNEIITAGINKNDYGYYGYIDFTNQPCFIAKTSYCETYETAEEYLKIMLAYFKKYGIKE